MLALHQNQQTTYEVLDIRVAVHAHSPIDQAALAALVDSLPGLHLVSPTVEPPPHVLVWDPGSYGRAALPHYALKTAILVLVNGNDIEDLKLPLTVAGLFSKTEPPMALKVAIRRIFRGEQYLSPTLALAWYHHHQHASRSLQAGLQELTPREQEVLAMLTEGLSNKEIAARLCLSVRTVEGHLARLYDKLEVHSRTEAALIALHQGLSA